MEGYGRGFGLHLKNWEKSGRAPKVDGGGGEKAPSENKDSWLWGNAWHREGFLTPERVVSHRAEGRDHVGLTRGTRTG